MKTLTELLKEVQDEQEMINASPEEEITEATSTKDFDITDDIGKFFVVTRPTKDSTKDDILFNIDVFEFATKIQEGLAFEDVVGIYKQKSDAGREATILIKQFETELNELEGQMEEFRKHKTELNDKKKAAVERIKKMKGE